MKYADTIRRLLHPFQDDTFWQFSFYAKELQDYRSFIGGQWDDSAAVDVNTRYLNPHEEDEALMRNHLGEQLILTQQLTGQLTVIDEINGQIQTLSHELQNLLQRGDDDLRRAVTTHDFAINLKNEAEGYLPTISNLLRQANGSEYSTSF